MNSTGLGNSNYKTEIGYLTSSDDRNLLQYPLLVFAAGYATGLAVGMVILTIVIETYK